MIATYKISEPFCCDHQLLFLTHETTKSVRLNECPNKLHIELPTYSKNSHPNADPATFYKFACRDHCFDSFLESVMVVESKMNLTQTGCAASQYFYEGGIHKCYLLFEHTDLVSTETRCKTNDDGGPPGAAEILEVRPQCDIPYPVAGLSVNSCLKKSPAGCTAEAKPSDKLVLLCTIFFLKFQGPKLPMFIDSISVQDKDKNRKPLDMLDAWQNCLNKVKYVMEQQIKYSNYSADVEFDMLQVGIEACKQFWVDLKFTMDIKYHCEEPSTKRQDDFARAARPTAWPTREINEERYCQTYHHSFNPSNQGYEFVNCHSFATEEVSHEWKCRANCLAYLHNSYNLPKFTYNNTTCRAVQITKAGDEFKCEFYDWAPDENVTTMRNGGCKFTKVDKDVKVELLKHECYEKTLSDPIIEPQTVAWIAPTGCSKVDDAFDRLEPLGESGVCPYSRGWPLEYEHSSKVEAFAYRFSWYHTEDEAREWQEDESQNINRILRDQFGEISTNVLEFYCKQQCLNSIHNYYNSIDQEAKGPCRAAAAIVFKFDQDTLKIRKKSDPEFAMYERGIYKCFFKTWKNEKDEREACVENGEVTLVNTDERINNIHTYQEFVLDEKCYEPSNTVNYFEMKPLEIRRIGCFSEDEKVEYPLHSEKIAMMKLPKDYTRYDIEKNTPEYCARSCFEFGYSVSGVFEKKCICTTAERMLAVHLIRADVKADEEGCTIPCSGNDSPVCGSRSHFQYYSNVSLYEKALDHVGCLNTMPEKDVLERNTYIFRANNTPEFCANWCVEKGNFLLSGVIYGSNCVCGNDIDYFYIQQYNNYLNNVLEENDEQTAGDVDKCKAKCPGDDTERCGSVNGQNPHINISVNRRTIELNRVLNKGCPLMIYTITKAKVEHSDPSLLTSVGICATVIIGQQYAYNCFCATVKEMKDVMSKKEALDDDKCNTKCLDGVTTKCGGPWISAVYQRALEYMGCYSNPPDEYDLLLHEFEADKQERLWAECEAALSPEMCANFCIDNGNYMFSGLEEGKWCYCGNSDKFYDLTPYGKLDCATRCPGDGSSRCGGTKEDRKMAVYKNHKSIIVGGFARITPSEACELQPTTQAPTTAAPAVQKPAAVFDEELANDEEEEAEDDEEGEKHYESKIKQCMDYLNRVGWNSHCLKAKRCQAILGVTDPPQHTTPQTTEKYSIQWCRMKVDAHGTTKPNLQCVTKCLQILENPPQTLKKYSIPWCRMMVDTHGTKNPKLQCVKKCLTILNNPQEISAEQEKYCTEKLTDFEHVKPSLSCVIRCKQLLGHISDMISTTPTPISTRKPEKFGVVYCQEKIKEHGEKKPPFSCVDSCRKKFGF